MASTTKIMTTIVILEKADLNETVTVSAKAGGTGGSRLGLKRGDKASVRDLLYGLMLRSGNDAAVALAEHVGGSVKGFAELMNEKAIELGLTNTHFVTPHGLDDANHYTTALELAKLTDYAMDNETFAKIVGTKSTTIYINNQSRQINNTNELLGVLNGVVGVKTGFTNNAGRCLVTETKRNNMDIITIVLGADRPGGSPGSPCAAGKRRWRGGSGPQPQRYAVPRSGRPCRRRGNSISAKRARRRPAGRHPH